MALYCIDHHHVQNLPQWSSAEAAVLLTTVQNRADTDKVRTDVRFGCDWCEAKGHIGTEREVIKWLVAKRSMNLNYVSQTEYYENT